MPGAWNKNMKIPTLKKKLEEFERQRRIHRDDPIFGDWRLPKDKLEKWTREIRSRIYELEQKQAKSGGTRRRRRTRSTRRH
jgi:hypothetical protein